MICDKYKSEGRVVGSEFVGFFYSGLKGGAVELVPGYEWSSSSSMSSSSVSSPSSESTQSSSSSARRWSTESSLSSVSSSVSGESPSSQSLAESASSLSSQSEVLCNLPPPMSSMTTPAPYSLRLETAGGPVASPWKIFGRGWDIRDPLETEIFVCPDTGYPNDARQQQVLTPPIQISLLHSSGAVNYFGHTMLVPWSGFAMAKRVPSHIRIWAGDYPGTAWHLLHEDVAVRYSPYMSSTTTATTGYVPWQNPPSRKYQQYLIEIVKASASFQTTGGEVMVVRLYLCSDEGGLNIVPCSPQPTVVHDYPFGLPPALGWNPRGDGTRYVVEARVQGANNYNTEAGCTVYGRMYQYPDGQCWLYLFYHPTPGSLPVFCGYFTDLYTHVGSDFLYSWTLPTEPLANPITGYFKARRNIMHAYDNINFMLRPS